MATFLPVLYMQSIFPSLFGDFYLGYASQNVKEIPYKGGNKSSKVTPMKSFDTLWIELVEKLMSRPEGSGTVAAVDSGVHSIGKKILEEAGEVWLAGEYESDEALAQEISQLIYHIQTMMLARGLKPDDIYKYL